jgi:DNA-binding response OmpR family regulator
MSKKKILLVIDDEKPIADGIKTMLTSEEIDCMAAYNGEEALGKAKEQQPDLILLDVSMPGLDGFEVLENLKKDVTTSNIPVIMVTSCDQPEDIEKAYSLGAADYVLKPFNFDDLTSRVAKLLKI